MVKFFLCLVACLTFAFGSTSARIKIKAVGDVMPGSYTPSCKIPADSGSTAVRNVKEYLGGADIVFGNLEGVFIDSGMKPCKCSDYGRKTNVCFEFGMPPYLAPKLKEMGFTLLGLDNNHVGDYGSDAYSKTVNILNDAGLLNAPKKGQCLFNINGKKIAAVAFGFSRGSARIDNLDAVRDKIAELKKQASLVIVSFHGGAEGPKAQVIPDGTEIFIWEKRGDVKAFARAAVDAGADIVLGHGPHVLRALELYKGKLIAYSLGNFFTYGHFTLSGPNGISAIIEAEIDENTGNFINGKIVPFYQANPGIPRFDEKGRAIESLKKLTESLPGSNLNISEDGNITPLNIPVR